MYNSYRPKYYRVFIRQLDYGRTLDLYIHGWKWIFLKILKTMAGGLVGRSRAPSGSRAKLWWGTRGKYEIWGFPDHTEKKIFTLSWGIKVFMSTSNFMIFQGVEYHKTGNATNTLDCFPIMHVFALFFYCFQLTSIPILMHWMRISENNSSSAVFDIKKFGKPNL